jgi:hypothetical protein
LATRKLSGVDLVELDEHDCISSFTVVARPMSALMALGARMREEVAQGG